MRVVSNVFPNCHFQVRDHINLFYQLVQQEFFKFPTKSSFLDFSQKIQEIKKEELFHTPHFFCKNNIVENSLYLALLKSLLDILREKKTFSLHASKTKHLKEKCSNFGYWVFFLLFLTISSPISPKCHE